MGWRPPTPGGPKAIRQCDAIRPRRPLAAQRSECRRAQSRAGQPAMVAAGAPGPIQIKSQIAEFGQPCGHLNIPLSTDPKRRWTILSHGSVDSGPFLAAP
jgi:hypothetical protein